MKNVMQVVALDVRIGAPTPSDRRRCRCGLWRPQISVDQRGPKSTSSVPTSGSSDSSSSSQQQMIPADEQSNFETFRDCLSTVVIERLAPETAKPRKRVKGRKNEIKPVVQIVNGDNGEADTNELSDFTEVSGTVTVLIYHVADEHTPVSCRRDVHQFATGATSALIFSHPRRRYCCGQVRNAARYRCS